MIPFFCSTTNGETMQYCYFIYDIANSIATDVFAHNPYIQLLRNILSLRKKDLSSLSISFILPPSYQSPINAPLFLTLRAKMRHESHGNQIHHKQLGVHVMKTASTMVEMFCRTWMVFFTPIIAETGHKENNCSRESEKQKMEEDYYSVNWLFMRWTPEDF